MRPGRIVDARFELLEVAGRGGMGEVWRARALADQRTVAMKFLLDPTGGARFAREAELLASVRHDALVGHIAHGDDDGLPWLAMEWLQGPTLTERLSAEPLETDEVLTLARRLASAISALHGAGVVHRDVKPSNVILCDGQPERAVLLDLGVARPLFAAPALTGEQIAIGTLGYMAPEQARGRRDIDPRADVFALGAVLHECLAGAPAFGGPHALAILSALLCEEPSPLRELRPDIPPDLADLVQAMLAKERSSRPSAADVARVLAEVRAGGAPQAARKGRACTAPTLSTAEWRLSLVAAVSIPGSDDQETLAASEHSAVVERVAELARSCGAEAIELPGGAILLVTEARGTAADRAAVLADALLTIRGEIPSAQCALAAGLAASAANDPSSEVLTRALRLASMAHAPLADAVAADLLPDRFGRAEHGQAFVLSTRTPSAAGAFVGREKEIALLEATLSEATEESAVRSVLVLAPPGTGKSRLGAELVRKLRARGDVMLLEARAEAARAGAVHALLGGLVRSTLGAGPNATVERSAVLAHVRTLGPTSEPPERLADFLAWLAGCTTLEGAGPELTAAAGGDRGQSGGALGDRDLMSRWLRRVLRAWLAAAAARGPLVLLLEDLHWSDADSLTLLDDALRSQRDRAILLVGLMRPEARSELPLGFPSRTELELTGLGQRAAERLVRAHLGASAEPGAVARIVERAQGNPLFLSELSRFVAEGRSEDLPATVVAILEARLGELAPTARRLLRAASVLGDTVIPAAVSAVSGESETEVTRVLSELGGRALVELDPDADGLFRFTHALVREVAYASLPPDERQRAHGRAAELLEVSGPEEATAIARHWELAGNRERAVTWLVAATHQAMERGADRDGIALATRGVSLGAQGLELAQLAWPLAIERMTLRIDLDEAARWLRVGLDNVPPTHPSWPIFAAGAVMYVAMAGPALDAATRAELGTRVVFTWLTSGVRVTRTRTAYLAATMLVLGLARLGRRFELSSILASCTTPEPRALAEQALYALARCPDAFYNTGEVGVVQAQARAARRPAAEVGDELTLGFCDYFEARLRALASMSRTLPEELEAVAALHRGTTYQSTVTGLDVCIATARARVDVSTLSTLRELHGRVARSRMDQTITELASIGLVEALLAAGKLEDAAAAIAEAPEPAAYTRGVRTVHLARLAAARGDAEGALGELRRAEPLLQEHAFAWQWEWLHATRVTCLQRLGRSDEAAAALDAGLVRLDVTLAGADEELRRFAEEHVEPVVALRAARATSRQG